MTVIVEAFAVNVPLAPTDIVAALTARFAPVLKTVVETVSVIDIVPPTLIVRVDCVHV